jgi:hypothetical protein
MNSKQNQNVFKLQGKVARLAQDSKYRKVVIVKSSPS